MTIKIYDPSNNALGFLNNVFDLKITKEISGMEEMSFYVPINSHEASLIQLEGYLYPEGEQLFVIREVNQHGNDIEVFCTLAIENLYGYCWEAITKKSISLVDAFEYAIQYTGWKFVNRSSKPAATRDIHIQNQTVWEALQVLCEVFFVELTVDTHTHTITVYDKVGEDTGTFFISDMNLVNFRKDMSTHKLITRLIPIGKDGLRISSVNGGKEYIDNNTYSSKLLYGLWIQTAYTNPQQLKEDATKMLEEYARPYVTYNVDIVDLYRKTGNQLFKFGIGDTVTLIDKLSEEKAQQRVVKMEIYPHNPQLNNIELSNKNKTFQDYFKMIQLMNNMANHFISTNGSYTGTGDSNINKSPSVDSVGNIHIQDGSISTDKIQANSITTDKLVANSITTDKLQANSIATNHLQANSVTTDKLQANSISTDKLQANSISTDKLQANSITSNKIQAKSIKAEHLQSNIIDSDKIFADAITSDKIQAGAITTDKLDANVVNTNHLIANSVTADKIKAQNITTDHLQAGSITADKIGAKAITTDHLQAGVVDAIHIKADSISSEHIQAGTITAGSTIIAEGAIGNAQISSIDANKIDAGEIDTSKVKIKGENGYLFIENNTLYVVDNKKQIRCELGVIEDNSNYGFIVRGVDGQTILIDHNGVHNAGITDGAIDNRKVSENANISGKKLDIDSVIRTINEDGSVSIQGTKVQVGNTTLDVELKKQTSLINEHTTKLESQQATIEANTQDIKLKVDTQTYTEDKVNMTSKLDKATSSISMLEDKINLKAEKTEITDAIGNLVIGGRNILKDSNVKIFNSTEYMITSLYFGDEKPVDGEIYTISIKGSLASTRTAFGIYNSGGSISLTSISEAHNEGGVYTKTFTWKSTNGSTTVPNTFINIYQLPKSVADASSIEWVKLEKGNKATDWTPAPEDMEEKYNQLNEEVTTTKSQVSELDVEVGNISSKVATVEETTTRIDGEVAKHEARIKSAESKITDEGITNIVKNAQFIKDIEGNITKVESTISSVEQTADSITKRVDGLDGKYTEIKQTVDNIDLTGKVSFSDLSTQGKTTINGGNITTGTVSGNMIQGGTIKGSLLQTYANSTTKGVRIMAEAMQLNDTSIFFGGDGKFNIQASKSFNVASMSDIYLMPGLLASGTPSGNGTVVIPNATLRPQKLYVVNDTTMDGALRVGGNISCGGNIIGKGNTQLGRTSIYLPRLGSSVTTDYLRLGTGYISMTDTGAFHFIPTSGSTNFTMARGSVWLPGASGNVTTDHFGIGYGYMACVDSGNFHFITKGGVSASLYAKTTVASYSLDDTIESRSSKKALDIISEVPVVNTEDGYRLASPKTKSVEATNVVNTSIEEETGKETINTDYNSVLATMWKAIQELQQENELLKQQILELKDN